MNIKKLINLVFVSSLIAGCNSLMLGTIKNTEKLSSGMSYEQVLSVMGNEPDSTYIKADEFVAVYKLHAYNVGWVPHNLIFNSDTRILKYWEADRQAYINNQAQLLHAVTPLLTAGETKQKYTPQANSYADRMRQMQLEQQVIDNQIDLNSQMNTGYGCSSCDTSY